MALWRSNIEGGSVGGEIGRPTVRKRGHGDSLRTWERTELIDNETDRALRVTYYGATGGLVGDIESR